MSLREAVVPFIYNVHEIGGDHAFAVKAAKAAKR